VPLTASKTVAENIFKFYVPGPDLEANGGPLLQILNRLLDLKVFPATVPTTPHSCRQRDHTCRVLWT